MQSKSAQHNNLHAVIMNLPANAPAGYSLQQKSAYAIGHRDARHAAAELVANEAPSAWRGVLPYTEEMGVAARLYLESIMPEGELVLPPSMMWFELYDAMIEAAMARLEGRA